MNQKLRMTTIVDELVHKAKRKAKLRSLLSKSDARNAAIMGQRMAISSLKESIKGQQMNRIESAGIPDRIRTIKAGENEPLFIYPQDMAMLNSCIETFYVREDIADRYKRERDEMVELLRPFGEFYNGPMTNEKDNLAYLQYGFKSVTVGDFRRAFHTLARIEQSDKEVGS